MRASTATHCGPRLRTTAIVLCSGLAALPAFAQVASDGSAALEEVVVTAQKRTQRLQDVPASISALSGELLARKGADSFQAYLNAVPSVSYFQNGGQDNAVFIRGVSGGLNRLSAPTTGVYIDEVPVTQSKGGTVDLNPFDLERLEVLRGPQGTLYGASSMGGTVRLIMNKPRFDGVASNVDARFATTRHGGTQYEANAMLNLPASEQLAIRLVAGYRDLDGYIDDVHLNRRDANTERMTTLRGMARWQPNERTDVLLTVALQDQEYGAHSEAFVDPSYSEYQSGFLYPESDDQPFRLYGLTINHELPFASLTSASNYFDKDALSVRDYTVFAPLLGIDLAADEGFGLAGGLDARLFTQEVRLASSGSGPWRWLIGGFYSEGTGPDTTVQTVTDAPVLAGVNIYASDIQIDQQQVAGFGEIGYELTPALTFTAGLRTSHYRSRGFDRESGELVGPVPIDEPLDSSDQFLDQRYTLNYKWDGERLLYAQAASGSREGGPSYALGLPSSCLADLNTIGYTTVPTQSEPDTLWTYEVGSKNTLADGRVTVNAAAYRTEWKDVQSLIILECGFSFNGNSGAATVKGAELETSARLFDGLSVSLAAAYTDTRITEANTSLGAVQGDPLPLVPEVNGNLGISYEFPAFGGAVAHVRGDVTYVGSQYASFRALPVGFEIPAYTLVNARVGVQWDRYEVALYATNLFDERVATFRTTNPLRDTILRPLTFGINLRASW